MNKSANALTVSSIGLAYPPPIKMSIPFAIFRRQSKTRWLRLLIPARLKFKSPRASETNPSTPAWKKIRSKCSPSNCSKTESRTERYSSSSVPSLKPWSKSLVFLRNGKLFCPWRETVITRSSPAKISVPSPWSDSNFGFRCTSRRWNRRYFCRGWPGNYSFTSWTE